MDEVENPALPHAGEASPTLRPIEEDEDSNASKPPLDTAEVEAILQNSDPNPPTQNQLPSRPTLKRESSAPPPPQPPPDPPQSNGGILHLQDAPDSLTLADLKKIRSTFPNVQSPQRQQILDYDQVYDFEYHDAQSLPVEIEEWFSYGEDEKDRLRKCKAAFSEEWKASEEGANGKGWLDVTEDVRRAFVTRRIEEIAAEREGTEDATKPLKVLTYLGLGVWAETAGRQEGGKLEDLFPDGDRPGSRLDEYTDASSQVQWIVAMVDTLHACDGLRVIYAALRKQCERDFGNTLALEEQSLQTAGQPPTGSLEMWCCLTLLYLFIEVARTTGGEHGQRLKKDIIALEPNLLTYFTRLISRLRWEESLPIPLTKMLLLSWKAILVSIGGIKDVDMVKTSLRTEEDRERDETDPRGQPIITASPLDYHLFRQEISSKYPAYHPPPPLFPLEPENNTILPPLKHRQPSSTSLASEAPFTGAPTVGTNSIMHQPVHIATPAPSPPPSPAGPGKAGKKQNYQTNQLFPFLYPPLDETSNALGGKGSTELQDVLVGRKWEGGDIPASILEAAELFAKRMRATRAMRQLWGVRVEFMKGERGWREEEVPKAKETGLLDEMTTWEELKKKLGLEGLEEDGDDESVNEDAEDVKEAPEEGFEILDQPDATETAEQGQPLPQTEEQRRLNAVENFYHDSLPYLQSFVVVLLKTVLSDLNDRVLKQGHNGLQAGIQFPNEVNGINSGNPNSAKPLENGTGPTDGIENTSEQLDADRTSEITFKAMSGILLLLFKWFKVNHVLQYEYLGQLLVDSQCISLLVKIWQTQEVGRLCHFRTEQLGKEFFYFCREDAKLGKEKKKDGEDEKAEESEDEALPPPIKLKRDTPEENLDNPLSPTAPLEFAHPPEVDELGYPLTPMPPSPMRNYSWRNIFTHINLLRVLQKITRRKTHRSLMMIQLKASTHLRKTLRTPVTMLRYYSLKLCKSQVPFCGRKWRSANMKIITAVWLSVPAELRDDWLSGGGGGMGGACVGDVDGTVEDSVPLEQSLRLLTHWWNVRHYEEQMGGEKGVGVVSADDEGGWFERELVKMEGMVGAQGEEFGVDGEVEIGEGWQGPIEGY